MMKKSYFKICSAVLLTSLVLSSMMVMAQQPGRGLIDIVIGDGEELTCEAPFPNCDISWHWGYSECIYPGEAMGGPCIIYSISYYCEEMAVLWGTEPSEYYYDALALYVGTTDKSAYSSETDWTPIDNLTIVRNEPYYCWDYFHLSEGWITLVLSQPYYYESGNLVVGLGVHGSCGGMKGSREGDDYSPMQLKGTTAVNATLCYSTADYLENGLAFPLTSVTQGNLSNVRPAIKLSVAAGMTLTSVPETIDMGFRPNGCWTEGFHAMLKNEGLSGTVTAVATDNSFFVQGGFQVPLTMNELDSIPYSVSTGNGLGSQSGNVVFTMGNGNTYSVPVTAEAYEPQSPDVCEMAQVESDSFLETIDASALHNDYHLPGQVPDGKDAVFKMNLATDAFLTARVVEGKRGKMALYHEGFEGEGGPKADNYLLYGEMPLDYELDFEDGTFGRFERTLQYYNDWVLSDADAHTGNYCMKSSNEGQDCANSSVFYTVEVPVDGMMSFYAKISSESGFDKGYFYLDGQTKIDGISGNGDWVLYSYPVSAGSHTFQWRYQKDCANNAYDDCFYVDDIVFSDVDLGHPILIDNELLASGTYYIVVSSTSEEFEISVELEHTPLPLAATVVYPMDGSNCYGDNPTSVSWTLGDYTNEYRLLFGETNPPTQTLVDWTDNLAETHEVTTESDKTYYWRVEEQNTQGVTQGQVWSFSTFHEIHVSDDQIIYLTPTGAGVKDGSSWTNAASDIQAAVDVAFSAEGDKPVLWLSQGTFPIRSTINTQGIHVYGSFNGVESPDYDLSLRDFDNHATVLDGNNEVCLVNATLGSVWDGCVFQHGNVGNLTIGEGGATLRNCKIMEGTVDGLLLEASTNEEVRLYHCTIEDNARHGVLQNSFCDLVLYDCEISNNAEVGVYANGQLVRCRIFNNGTGTAINGRYELPAMGNLTQGGQLGRLVNCLVANNGTGTNYNGIYNTTIVNNNIGVTNVPYWNELNVYNSIIWGNETQVSDGCFGRGAHFYYSAVQEIREMGIETVLRLAPFGASEGILPGFVSPSEGVGVSYSGGDWSLTSASPCVNFGDPEYAIDVALESDLLGNQRVQMGRIDLGALESSYDRGYQFPLRPDGNNIIYVRQDGQGDGSSWENAAGDLWEVIQIVNLYETPPTIWVAEGLYQSSQPTDKTYYDGHGYYVTDYYAFPVKKNLRIFGGFEGVEPADYDLSLRDFEHHASVLEGHHTMRLWYQNAPLAEENTAWIDGFTLIHGSGPSDGAGAYLQANTTLANCRVEHNIGVGVFAENATIRNCVVENNTGQNGGGVYAINCSLVQCLIANNEASGHGGGVFLDNSDLLQCDVVNNLGGGVYVCSDNGNSVSRLANSILWGNEGENLSFASTILQANTFMIHCAVENGKGLDNGTIPLVSDNLDDFGPHFACPSADVGLTSASGNWHLTEGSPCVDAGTNAVSWAEIPQHDLSASARIQNGQVDLGVFESLFGADCVLMDLRDVCIRSGESYDFYGTSLTAPGEYEHRWTVESCDSLVMLRLHVAEVVYVSELGAGVKDGSSWDNALDGNTFQSSHYSKLAEAMSSAVPYTQFWLASGTYLTCDDLDAFKCFALKEGVSVYGGFAGTEVSPADRDPDQAPTVFSGEIQGDDDDSNNTECLFVTTQGEMPWSVPAVLDGLTVTKGYGTDHQGVALRVLFNTSVSVNQCTLTDNLEGCVYNEGLLRISQSDISENVNMDEAFATQPYPPVYYYDAGAIRNTGTGVVDIEDCVFQSNYSIQNGAVCNQGLMRIEGSVFENNTANKWGTIFSPGKIKVYNTNFENNRAENQIAVLDAWDSLEMVNCSLINNYSNYYTAHNSPNIPGGGSGSANYAGYRTSGVSAGGYCQVVGCSFIENNAGTCKGGALSVLREGDVEDCLFVGNKGIASWHTPPDPNDPGSGGITIGVNVIDAYPDGGALFVGGIARVTNCVFKGNEGYTGNTIALDMGASLTMDRCKVVEGNQTMGSPQGAVAVMMGSTLTVRNSLFANNNTSALVNRENARCYFENTTFVNNTAQAFLFNSGASEQSWMDFTNCIISGYEELTYVSGLIDLNGELLEVQPVLTFDHTVLNDVNPMFVAPTTVLGVDPNLCALDADFRLSEGSPCINAGVLTDQDPLGLDLGGEVRVKDCAIDLGAYEFGAMQTTTITDEWCEGVPYQENGFDIPALEAGVWTFERLSDCNVLQTLELTVNPTSLNTIYEVVCDSYELNGVTYSESGTYIQHLTNHLGCDSILTLNLVVNPEVVMNDVEDITAYHGEQVQLAFTSPNPHGVCYHWTNDDPTIGLGAQGDGDFSFEVSLQDGEVHEAHLTVTPSLVFDGTVCNVGEPKSFTMVLLPYEGFELTVSATSNDEAKGTTSGSGSYALGSECTVSALPYTGYVFYYWAEDGQIVSLEPNYQFQVTRNRHLVACFMEEDALCKLNFSLDIPTAAGWQGNTLVVHYSDVDFTEYYTVEAPNCNNTFSRHLLDGTHVTMDWICGSDVARCYFTIKYDNDIVAYETDEIECFFHDEFDVDCAGAYQLYDVLAVPNNGDYGTTNGSGGFSYGTQCTLTAVANEGYVFHHWEDANGVARSFSPTYSFEVYEDQLLIANFVESEGMCGVTFDLSHSYYDWYGVALTITYEDYGFVEQLNRNGHYVRYVESGASIGVGVVQTSWAYEFGSHGVVVGYESGAVICEQPSLYPEFRCEFEADCEGAMAPISITAVADPIDAGIVMGAGGYTNGSTCQLTAVPYSGYAFRYWTEKGEVVSLDEEYSFRVTEERSFVAHFVPVETLCGIVFKLYDSGGNGWQGNSLKVHYPDIPYSEIITLNEGAEGEIHRKVSESEHAVVSYRNWGSYSGQCSLEIVYENGVSLYPLTELNSMSIPLTLETDCASVGAGIVYITTASEDVEKGSVTEGGTFNYGSRCSVSAIPNEGYAFLYWSNNGVAFSREQNYSFVATEDLDLVAHFVSQDMVCEYRFELTNGYHYQGWGGNVLTVNYDDIGFVEQMTLGTESSHCFVRNITARSNVTMSLDQGGDVLNMYLAVYCEDGDWICNLNLVNISFPRTFRANCNSALPETPEVTVMANPPEAGEVSGGGTYEVGSVCHLEAVANEGYSFGFWGDEDCNIFYSPEVDYEVIQSCTLTAYFYVVITADADPSDGGSINNSGWHYWGTWGKTSTCYLNATPNEGFVFDYWEKDGEVVSYEPYYTFEVLVPEHYVAHFSSVQTTALNLGWNWWTPTVNTDLSTVETALGVNGLLINSQDGGFARYEDNEWSGTLTEIFPGQMYKILTSNACTFTLRSTPLPLTTIDIEYGYNWFGYYGGNNLTLSQALGSFTPVEGDVIIAENGDTATFNNGWNGALTTLVRGHGYIYVSHDNQVKTLAF